MARSPVVTTSFGFRVRRTLTLNIESGLFLVRPPCHSPRAVQPENMSTPMTFCWTGHITMARISNAIKGFAGPVPTLLQMPLRPCSSEKQA